MTGWHTCGPAHENLRCELRKCSPLPEGGYACDEAACNSCWPANDQCLAGVGLVALGVTGQAWLRLTPNRIDERYGAGADGFISFGDSLALPVVCRTGRCAASPTHPGTLALYSASSGTSGFSTGFSTVRAVQARP